MRLGIVSQMYIKKLDIYWTLIQPLDMLQATVPSGGSVITLGTAHPAKFPLAVESSIRRLPEIPDRLKKVMDGDEKFSKMGINLEKIKDFISLNI